MSVKVSVGLGACAFSLLPNSLYVTRASMARHGALFDSLTRFLASLCLLFSSVLWAAHSATGGSEFGAILPLPDSSDFCQERLAGELPEWAAVRADNFGGGASGTQHFVLNKMSTDLTDRPDFKSIFSSLWDYSNLSDVHVGSVRFLLHILQNAGASSEVLSLMQDLLKGKFSADPLVAGAVNSLKESAVQNNLVISAFKAPRESSFRLYNKAEFLAARSAAPELIQNVATFIYLPQYRYVDEVPLPLRTQGEIVRIMSKIHEVTLKSNPSHRVAFDFQAEHPNNPVFGIFLNLEPARNYQAKTLIWNFLHELSHYESQLFLNEWIQKNLQLRKKTFKGDALFEKYARVVNIAGEEVAVLDPNFQFLFHESRANAISAQTSDQALDELRAPYLDFMLRSHRAGIDKSYWMGLIKDFGLNGLRIAEEKANAREILDTIRGPKSVKARMQKTLDLPE